MLPLYWTAVKINSLFSERSEKVSDTDFAPLSVSKGGVVPQIATVAKTNAGDNRKRACIGDYVINSRSDRRGSSGVSQHDGSVSLINIVLTPRCEHNSRFFHYLLRSHNFIEEYYRNGRGIAADLWTTRYTEMKGIYLPLPPRTEQDQIVRYLDWKVSQVNRLINTKKKQIGLLQEQKRGVINAAVTRSLNPDAPMKDSGVEWLGKIPEQWQVCRCKYLFSERNERSESGSETHLSMSQKYGLIPDNQLSERRMLSASYAGGKLCYKDDLVLNRLKAHLGVFALAPQMGVVSPDYTILRVNTTRIIPDFSQHILHCPSCRPELCIRVRGVVEGFWRLYTEDFNTIVLPLPSLEKQREILDYINAFIEKTTKLVSSIEDEITLLQEYRTRLISDVVTGKMDVRGIAVPEYETVEEAASEEAEDGVEQETDDAESTEGL